MTDADEYPTVKEILPPRSEYRFELEQGQRQAIRLVPGTGDAEIFGAGLYAKDAGGWYVFGDEVKACVCSWNGCEIELCECESVGAGAEAGGKSHTVGRRFRS